MTIDQRLITYAKLSGAEVPVEKWDAYYCENPDIIIDSICEFRKHQSFRCADLPYDTVRFLKMVKSIDYFNYIYLKPDSARDDDRQCTKLKFLEQTCSIPCHRGISTKNRSMALTICGELAVKNLYSKAVRKSKETVLIDFAIAALNVGNMTTYSNIRQLPWAKPLYAAIIESALFLAKNRDDYAITLKFDDLEEIYQYLLKHDPNINKMSFYAWLRRANGGSDIFKRCEKVAALFNSDDYITHYEISNAVEGCSVNIDMNDLTFTVTSKQALSLISPDKWKYYKFHAGQKKMQFFMDIYVEFSFYLDDSQYSYGAIVLYDQTVLLLKPSMPEESYCFENVRTMHVDSILRSCEIVSGICYDENKMPTTYTPGNTGVLRLDDTECIFIPTQQKFTLARGSEVCVNEHRDGSFTFSELKISVADSAPLAIIAKNIGLLDGFVRAFIHEDSSNYPGIAAVDFDCDDRPHMRVALPDIPMDDDSWISLPFMEDRYAQMLKHYSECEPDNIYSVIVKESTDHKHVYMRIDLGDPWMAILISAVDGQNDPYVVAVGNSNHNTASFIVSSVCSFSSSHTDGIIGSVDCSGKYSIDNVPQRSFEQQIEDMRMHLEHFTTDPFSETEEIVEMIDMVQSHRTKFLITDDVPILTAYQEIKNYINGKDDRIMIVGYDATDIKKVVDEIASSDSQFKYYANKYPKELFGALLASSENEEKYVRPVCESMFAMCKCLMLDIPEPRRMTVREFLKAKMPRMADNIDIAVTDHIYVAINMNVEKDVAINMAMEVDVVPYGNKRFTSPDRRASLSSSPARPAPTNW